MCNVHNIGKVNKCKRNLSLNNFIEGVNPQNKLRGKFVEVC